MYKKIIVGILLAGVLIVGMTSFGFAQMSTLDEVLKRGVLRVGIMLDFPPLGFRDAGVILKAIVLTLQR